MAATAAGGGCRARHPAGARAPAARRAVPRAVGSVPQQPRAHEPGAAGPRAEGDDASPTLRGILDSNRRNDTQSSVNAVVQIHDKLVARTREDTARTVGVVVEAHDAAAAALNPAMRERKSIAEVKAELQGMKEQLRAAHDKVHLSEARLAATQSRLAEMEEAVRGVAGGMVLAAAAGASVTTAETAAGGRQGGGGAAVAVNGRGAGESAPGPVAAPGPGRYEGKGGNLREFWYPVEFSSTLSDGTLVPLELFGEPWVLFRDEAGRPGCLRDSCAHRACPLSLGKLEGGEVQCPYHGWQFDTAGSCTKTPSTNQVKGASVRALPCYERGGLVWVFPGDGIPPDPAANGGLGEADAASYSRAGATAQLGQELDPPEGFTVHAELMLEVPVEHGLLMENLLDLAHAPFTHTSTFAKGWSVPDLVNFKTAAALGGLGGSWEPYPIDMSFEPPCMVLSTIGLAQPGKLEFGARASECERHLHQLHVCLPAGDGRTRLLYRMSLDFAGILRGLPFIKSFWSELANQVLGEDLRLVLGQQRNMKVGADVWENPVQYDKLGVRYRRWRNNVQYGNPSLRAEIDIE